MSAPAASWCDPAGESPAQVRSSDRLVASGVIIASEFTVETYRKNFQRLGYVPDRTIAFLGLGAAGKLETLPALVDQ